jgi:hypothetical protein
MKECSRDGDLPIVGMSLPGEYILYIYLILVVALSIYVGVVIVGWPFAAEFVWVKEPFAKGALESVGAVSYKGACLSPCFPHVLAQWCVLVASVPSGFGTEQAGLVVQFLCCCRVVYHWPGSCLIP